MKRYLYFVMTGLLFLITLNNTKAQQVVIQSSNPVTGDYVLECEDLPKLSPYSPESPRPSYGMFWIFEDDGTFSFNEYPVHQFGVSNFNVTVDVTPRYTPINKKPSVICQIPGSPNPIVPAPSPSNPKYQFGATSVYLQANRDPFFDHERTLILSYENPFKDAVNNVFLTLYFDSTQTSLVQTNTDFNLHNGIVDAQGQTLAGIKAYNSEFVISSPVVTPISNGNFNSCITIKAQSVEGYSSHNIYFRFLTDILLGQVNMMAELRTVIEDSLIVQSKNLNEPVVSGYDPNSISVDMDTICLAQMEPNEILTYTVHFQNEGNGPTQGVKVIWPYVYDLEYGSVLHIESKFDNLLKLPLGKLHDGIEWDFELSLPGTHQDEFECDHEATKGWLQFSVETYDAGYYLNNYGSPFGIESTAIIEFPNVSIMETMPAVTVFTDNCSKSANWLSNSLIHEDEAKPGIAYAVKDKNNQLHITLDETYSDEIELSLFNSCGSMIYNARVHAQNESDKDIIIHLNDITPGLYIIRASSKAGINTRKIIL